MDAARQRCTDCKYRFVVGRSPRCNPCRKRRARRTRHDAHLRKTYNINITEYDALLQTQNGTCAICDGGTSKNFLAVDHNHATGEVRGLLCANCNRTLGRFRDSAERFRRAADYLDTPPARKVLNCKQ